MKTVRTVSKQRAEAGDQWAGPLYLDASALIKLYLPEKGSDELDAAIRGRSDLLVSDLAITEIVSALARRRREGSLTSVSTARIQRQIRSDVGDGLYSKIDIIPDTHREAERFLLALERVPLRAADALHLAMATLTSAGAIVTYDRKLAEAALQLGSDAVP